MIRTRPSQDIDAFGIALAAAVLEDLKLKLQQKHYTIQAHPNFLGIIQHTVVFSPVEYALVIDAIEQAYLLITE